MKIKLIYSNGYFIGFNENEAPLLYKENFYGRPIGIGKPKTPIFTAKMQFNFYEALYLVKTNKVEVYDIEGKKLSEKEIIEEGKKYIELFEEKYLVYEDLRNKGYVIKPGMKYGVTFMVYEYGPGLDHAPFLVDVLRQDSSFSDVQIMRAGRLTHSVRKKLLITSVDTEKKKINYYLFEWFE